MLIERRADLLRLLEAYTPADDREQQSYDYILEFVRKTEDPFRRDQYEPGHVTASGFVLDGKKRRTLLVWHTKLERWLQPGGHVDATDATVQEAAQREVLEETGRESTPLHASIVDVDMHPIPAKRGEPAHHHMDIRFAFIAGDEVGPADHKLRWIKEKEIGELNLDYSAARGLHKAFRLL